MRYVVDGYNVTFRMFGPSSASVSPEEMREALLHRLRLFGTRRRRITVVFDGAGPGIGQPTRFDAGGVEIRFARSADDEIVKMVRDHPNPAKLRVVSHDREVTGRTRKLGARVVRVVDFLEELAGGADTDMEPGEPPEKYDP